MRRGRRVGREWWQAPSAGEAAELCAWSSGGDHRCGRHSSPSRPGGHSAPVDPRSQWCGPTEPCGIVDSAATLARTTSVDQGKGGPDRRSSASASCPILGSRRRRERWRHRRPGSSRSAPPRTRTSSSTCSRRRTALLAVANVARLREPRTTIGGVNLVAGFRPELWAVVAPDAAPVGRGRVQRTDPWACRPRTARDAARHRDLVGGRLVRRRVRYLAVDRRGAHGARHARPRDGRVAVPPRPRPDGIRGRHREPVDRRGDIRRARPPGLAGEAASILLLQQWAHDAISWEALPVTSQEAIIGRRKSDSEELDPRPPTSHVARTDQDRFGKIFRRNVAYGTVSDHGTIFVGFCGARVRSSRCSKAWSAGVRAARSTHQRRARRHRCVLRHPVSGPAGGVRRGRPSLTSAGTSRRIASSPYAAPMTVERVSPGAGH